MSARIAFRFPHTQQERHAGAIAVGTIFHDGTIHGKLSCRGYHDEEGIIGNAALSPHGARQVREQAAEGIVVEAMDIDSHEVQLVKQTFAMVDCVATTASHLFFNRLFELDPDLRALFRSDINSQRLKFMAALRFMVNALDKPDVLSAMTARLGQVHEASGVASEHYVLVGDAWLWTLQRTLGRSFTPEVQAAWRKAYAIFAEQMQQATHEIVP